MAEADKSSPTHPWIKDKVLGTGGFGTVTLWRHNETGNTVALKKCRWGSSSINTENILTPKHIERWEKEVEIMNRLDHAAVVKCFDVPNELQGAKGDLPMLCMEYCSGGDLRKVLNRPENCCGLREVEVRACLRDMTDAVAYLHSLRIIHRDLKPENIVLQNVDGQIRYKLIDLGYAKELEHGSVCTSFVGTLQYLAPELFLSKRYSCTVDYWSLGLVVHEIITGMIKAFIVETCQLVEYEVSENISIGNIKDWVEKDSKVSKEDQRLLLPRGQPPDSSRSATQCWAPPDEDEWLLYVFSDTVTRPHVPPHFPSLVEEMLRQSKGSQKLYRGWREMGESTLRQVHAVVDRVQQVEGSLTALNTKVLEIQCSPFARGKSIDSLDAVIGASEELYSNLRRKSKEQRSQKSDNTDMCKLMVQALKKRDRMHQDLYKHLEKQCECLTEVAQLCTPLESVLQEIARVAQNISTLQMKRQKDIWKIMEIAIVHKQNSGPPRSLQAAQPNVSLFPYRVPLPEAFNALVTLLEKSAKESVAVINENRSLRSQMMDLISVNIPTTLKVGEAKSNKLASSVVGEGAIPKTSPSKEIPTQPPPLSPKIKSDILFHMIGTQVLIKFNSVVEVTL
ncbi:Inhibitor of nuclear factor kappa-B kinase subunit alpha [Armadillidium nasatum]|uniref:IkappaB kinase n=1 Tax=Armadillidium nasatum TaxID=96803 RepID=A0A5N5SJD9_9CRUS|nr:Inhibitor of nuclear factor kappa-B kinase subunit alpha [Armadillidium nasatum]